MAAGDSLLFDGVDDQIVNAVGGTPTFGPGTIAAIFKYDTSLGTDCTVFSSNWEMGIRAADDLLNLWDGANVRTGTVILNAEWYLVVLTKATGTVAAREHKYRYSTSSWTHTNLSATSPNVAPGASAWVGSFGGGGFFKGSILIAGAWNTEYTTDGAVEALNLQGNAAAWTTAAPREGWYCNTMSAIQSFGAVGTSDESSRTGTTLDVGDVPAGWSETGLTYPSAVNDFARKMFPWVLGDARIQGATRAGARLRKGGKAGPSPMGGFERYIFSRLHPVFVTSVTYEKLGDLIAGTLIAGADVFEAAETGSLTAGTVTAGADVFTAAETGSLVASALAAGADVFTAAETGTLAAFGFMAGVGSKAAEKAGSLTVGTITAGADVYTAVEAGAVTTSTQPRGADVFEASEAGSLTTAAQLRGADVFTAAETGSLTPGTFLAGGDASTFNRTGSLTTNALLSGVAVKLGSYLKTGSLTVGVTLAGADTATLTRAGSLLSAGLLAGGKIREKTKAGAVTTGALVAGADSVTYTETGSLTVSVLLAGADAHTAVRLGSLTPSTVLGGVSFKIAAIGPPAFLEGGGVSTGFETSTLTFTVDGGGRSTGADGRHGLSNVLEGTGKVRVGD